MAWFRGAASSLLKRWLWEPSTPPSRVNLGPLSAARRRVEKAQSACSSGGAPNRGQTRFSMMPNSCGMQRASQIETPVSQFAPAQMLEARFVTQVLAQILNGGSVDSVRAAGAYDAALNARERGAVIRTL